MGKSPEREKLEEAIANLYVVFEEYPIPEHWIKCNSKQKKSRLNCIQKLKIDDLHDRYEDMGYIPLDIDSYKCLLPRILQLIAFQNLYTYALGENMKIDTLDKYEWLSWEINEQASIRKFLIALWKYMLSEYPSPVPFIDAIAIDILYVVNDKLPYFKILDDHSKTLIGIQHLADFVQWTVIDDNELREYSWIMPCLEKAYYDHIDTPIGEKIAKAVRHVELRRMSGFEES